MINFSIITLFPQYFQSLHQAGVTARAFDGDDPKSVIELINPRDFASGNHKKVDDASFGGGGQVMRADVLSKAIDHALTGKKKESSRVIHFSPSGEKLNANKIKQLARYQNLVLLCSRYEAIDQRVIDAKVDEEISIGDYVLSGGELAALVLIDAITRLIPGVINADSLSEESFAIAQKEGLLGLLEYPHFTKPQDWQGTKVPEVLISGNHKKIANWRMKQAILKTWLNRPEIIQAMIGSEKFANDYQKQLNQLLDKLFNELIDEFQNQ